MQKGTLTHEQVLKIARLFKVSTDFLLGETNIPDRKNYDIAELGLSVEAAKNLYTGRVNTEVVNLLLENARFAELTYRIAQYFDDTFASGIAAQNAMLTTLSTLLRTKVKTPEAAKAAKDISLRRKPVYQGDLDDIEMYFMAAIKEIKKGIGSHYAEQEAMSKKVAEKMFTELTKGQDVQHPTITAEQLTDAMLDSVSGMEGATPEALEQLRNGLLGILQSTAEQESRRELYDGLKLMTQREQTYLLYRYGFTDGEEHPLIGTAIYFYLPKGRAQKTEEQTMDNLWLELPWWFD